MITRTNAFVTSDQKTFAELDTAIGHELSMLFPGENTVGIVAVILKNRDNIVDWLTTTPTSKSRARSINGGKKKRTPKPDAAVVGSPQ